MSKKIGSVLQEAAQLIRGPRAKHYGAPRKNFNRIALAWTAYGFRVEDSHGALRDVTMHDVAQAMILLKTVRQADGYHRDSTVDQGGYAELTELVNEDAAYVRYLQEINS